MKIAILGDTHFGARNDITIFHKHFETYFTWMLAKLQELGIDTVIQLGDLFDRRKFINFFTLSESKRYFFDKYRDSGIKLHVIIGNHDIYYRDSLLVNTQEMVLREYSNITVYSEPKTLNIGGTSFDMIPWICKENEQEISEFIARSVSDICIGHFEIKGFCMYRGIESHEGIPSSLFEKYERVFSGHYHTRSERGNIIYTGTPYEMTWQDYNDPKGFYVFDTKTRSTEFVENPNTIFERIEYDNGPKSEPDIEDKFVKLVVINKTDLYKFDSYLNLLYSKRPYEIKIVEDLSEFLDGEVTEDINLENTLDVLSNYIDSLDTELNKEDIKQFMKLLYVEASNLEVV